MSATWETEHSFYYAAATEVTARELAEHLLGLEGVYISSAKVLAKLLETRVTHAELILDEIELSSYRENFFFRLVFGEGEEAEKKIEELRQKLKLDKMDGRTLAGLAVAGSIAWGAWKLSERNDSADPSVMIHIENSFNHIAAEAEMPREEVLEIFESALSGDENLLKSAAKLLKPDGSDISGRIEIDGKESLTIPEEVSKAVPKEYIRPPKKEHIKEYEDVQIVLRAVDLDKPGSGWWAIVPDVSDRRVKVVLGPDVDPDTLPVGKYFQAAFTIEFKEKKNGDRVPDRLTLLEKLQD